MGAPGTLALERLLAGNGSHEKPASLALLSGPGAKLHLASELPSRETRAAPLPVGIAPFDRLLSGGLPRGRLTELVGRRSSGRFSLVLAALASVTSAGEAAAFVDRGSHFDPQTACEAGVDLERLLWARPQRVKEALAAAEMLLSTGFPLVVVDLGLPPLRGAAPEAAWVRLARAAEIEGAALLLAAPYRVSGFAAGAVVRMDEARFVWVGRGARGGRDPPGAAGRDPGGSDAAAGAGASARPSGARARSGERACGAGSVDRSRRRFLSTSGERGRRSRLLRRGRDTGAVRGRRRRIAPRPRRHRRGREGGSARAVRDRRLEARRTGRCRTPRLADGRARRRGGALSRAAAPREARSGDGARRDPRAVGDSIDRRAREAARGRGRKPPGGARARAPCDRARKRSAPARAASSLAVPLGGNGARVAARLAGAVPLRRQRGVGKARPAARGAGARVPASRDRTQARPRRVRRARDHAARAHT